ncbi:MMPL family transporter [Pseudactinotalea sp. HY160]|uniref:MMPL family transporter n=1 Tax=Pseudactinotalea sp. HY160 TaxID=2654490 RepID=UPI00128D1C94|nr:MMPL family transporter [Pseudactinotalea sp. HY160]MPV50690.1 MMPL family transporter [Pseudactinotalea sp. HY160]
MSHLQPPNEPNDPNGGDGAARRGRSGSPEPDTPGQPGTSAPPEHRASARRGAAWARVVIPALVIVAWLVGAAIGGPYFGKVSEVSSNDSTAYLPTSAEATQVQNRLPEFLGDDAIPAVVVITGEQKLTEEQLHTLADLATGLGDLPEVSGAVSPPIPSEDGRAVEIFVPLDADADVDAAVEALRSELASTLPADLTSYVTGPAGFLGDLVEAFGGIDTLLLLVAIAAVFVILVIVYRSPLLPLIVLSTSLFALCVALLTVWWLAKAGVVLLSGQTQGILFILVIGAATDYSLLYVSRYREALRDHHRRWEATREAWRGSVGAITASGSTVIAGLLCLLLSELASNRDLGPIAAIGIVFAMLAALTFLPALLMACGRTAFWPRRPHVLAAGAAGEQSDAHLPTKGVWARLPAFVQRRHRPVWITVVVLLLGACVGLGQLKAEGVPQSDLVLGASEARAGQEALAEHFPGGSGSPVYVITSADDLQEVAGVLLTGDDIGAVSVAAAESPSGSAPVTTDGVQPAGPPGSPAPDPTVSHGDVLLQATLTVAADSAAAGDVVRDLRAELGDRAQIGGVSATDVDSNDASIRDRTLIIPIVLVVILGILMLLLRSVVAPLMLIGTVVLSFGATLGIAALVFNHVFHMPGADPAVPLFGFVFLVALGIDYNIFLMTRVREESVRHGTHAGIGRGLAITGGVITSAGLVLAATFAALSVIPILFLVQIAFIVAFGVLLDTLLVRSILVPALGHQFGRHLWWPSKKITD